jgi:hypothetical protein
MAELVRYVQTDVSQNPVEVFTPGDSDRGGADRVLEHEVPADDPRDELAHRRVRIGVGAPGDRDHRGELGVAQPGERAADAGDDERHRHPGAGALGDRRRRAHEQSGADDAADAQRDEGPRAERSLERMLADDLRVGEKPVDRLGPKQ